MNSAKIEEFVKKHWIILLASGVGIIVVVIVLIQRSQKSTSGVTLDTIDSDLQQIDWDINNLGTTMDSWGSVTSTPLTTGTPANPPTTPSPAKPTTNKAPTPSPTTQTIPIAAAAPAPKPVSTKAAVSNPPKNKLGLADQTGEYGVPIKNAVGTTVKVPVGVLNAEARRRGSGGPGNTYVSNITDNSAWGFIGDGDYSILFDNTFQNVWAFPGDYSDYDGLN